MDLNKLTLEDISKIMDFFNGSESVSDKIISGLNAHVGEKVIIRTYSAGVHYGELVEKCGSEVILKNARRLWKWVTANKGISLSEVAMGGLSNESMVCSPVDLIWLKAIEIIPCSSVAIESIESQNEYRA